PGAAQGMSRLRKIDLQLSSKMRFASAQLSALYGSDLWLRSASHANEMASRLASGLQALIASGRAPGVELPYPVESNGVFVVLPPETAARARERFAFGAWPASEHLYRFMCAFDTTEADVDALLELIAGGAA